MAAAMAVLGTACGNAAQSHRIVGSQAAAAAAGLGRLAFETDHRAQASLHVAGDGSSPDPITLTDEKGYRWTLSVPGDIMGGSLDLTITPLRSVVGPESLHLASGVLVEPAAAMLRDQPSLTVVPPLGVQQGQIYTAGTDGSVLRYARPAGSDGQTAQLLELGTYVVSDRPPAAVDVLADYARASQFVAAYSQLSVAAAPTPTPFPLHCLKPSDLSAGLVVEYVRAIESPEREYFDWLMQSYSAAVLRGRQVHERLPDLPLRNTLASTLLDRIEQRLGQALKQHANDPSAFVALAAAGTDLGRMEAMVGDRGHSSIDDLLSVWARRLGLSSPTCLEL